MNSKLSSESLRRMADNFDGSKNGSYLVADMPEVAAALRELADIKSKIVNTDEVASLPKNPKRIDDKLIVEKMGVPEGWKITENGDGVCIQPPPGLFSFYRITTWPNAAGNNNAILCALCKAMIDSASASTEKAAMPDAVVSIRRAALENLSAYLTGWYSSPSANVSWGECISRWLAAAPTPAQKTNSCCVVLGDYTRGYLVPRSSCMNQATTQVGGKWFCEEHKPEF